MTHHRAFAVSDPPLDAGLPRCALRGSLDPTTGIFYRAQENHTRIRTLQACDKCRVRKAKCSGDRPVCERCRTRGLTCQYAPERRTRKWTGRPKTDRSVAPVSPPAENANRQPRRTSIPESRPAHQPGVVSENEGADESPLLAFAFDPAAFTIADDDMGPVYVHPTDDVHHSILFHPPSGPPLLVSDVQPSFPFPYDADSPARSPSASTSSTASPILTRASSYEPPTTPINTYPNSPFIFPSYSPTYTSDAYFFSTDLTQCGTWHEGVWEGNAF